MGGGMIVYMLKNKNINTSLSLLLADVILRTVRVKSMYSLIYYFVIIADFVVVLTEDRIIVTHDYFEEEEERK